jgi:glycosyltransferase involved in cell wall biosynthesis
VSSPLPSRVLIATPEVLGSRRAGPAVRAWHLARALASSTIGCTVTLAAPRGEGEVDAPGFAVAGGDAATLSRLAREADVLVVQGDLLTQVPALGRPDAVVVADLYDPYQLEALERTSTFEPDIRRRAIWAAGRAIDGLLRRGDVFLCAGGRQRDFWLGALAGAGRINEATHAQIDALLLDVPFGVDDEPPRHIGPVLRDVVRGIGTKDLILWWGGGIYEWFDPFTLLEATARVVEQFPHVHLVFAGSRHPNRDVAETPTASRARTHADELGILDRNVHFLDWVPYDERSSYLLESDVAVSTHRDSIETTFSYRTRLLDALWAGLPVVATGGDGLGELISTRGGGVVVPAGDVDALVEALIAFVSDADWRAGCAKAARELGEELTWSAVVEPFVEFCRAPRPAPDRLDPLIAPMLASPGALPPNAPVATRARRLATRLTRRAQPPAAEEGSNP